MYNNQMYTPPNFRLTDEQIGYFLTDPGLAYLISPGFHGMLVTPLPVSYDPARNSLIGHVSRANPHWRNANVDAESLAILRGVDGYISPSLYATKTESGEVVPTWNYEVVIIYGQLKIHDDPAWLHEQVAALTDHHEARQEHPWGVSDAPEPFVDRQLRGIVGVELEITRWEGKAKMSQNQPVSNRHSVIEGLATSGDPRQQQVAERVAAYRAE